MPTANITLNGTPGSNTNLPIGVLVQLNNLNTGGELTYLWTILDQPPGPTDVLSSTVIQNPTFTPRKEGTYLIQLVINQSMPNQTQQTIVASVLQLLTRERVPASGETNEASPTSGWGLAAGNFLRLVDKARAQAGHLVGVAGTNGMQSGDILEISGVSTIKSGLPGQAQLPTFTKALGTSSTDTKRTLVILQQAVDGSLTPNINDLINCSLTALYGPVSGSPAVDDLVYLSDTGTFSLIPGTLVRIIGIVVESSGGTYSFEFNGTTIFAQVGLAKFLVNGSEPTLPNSVNIKSYTSTLQFETNADVVPMAIKQFAGATSNSFEFLDSTGSLKVHFDSSFNLNAAGNFFIKTLTPATSIILAPGGSVNPFAFNDSGNFLLNTLNANIIGAGDLKIATTAGSTGVIVAPGGLSDAWEFDGSGNIAGNLAGSQKIFKSSSSTGNLTIGTELASNLIFQTNTTNRWQIATSGELQALGGNRAINNVLDPVNDQDAATKLFVETTNYKQSCRVATTGNITLSGIQTIDGVLLSANDRVLVKDQTTQSQNGIYAVSSIAWNRTSDCNSSTKVTSGLRTFISQGTINSKCMFYLFTVDPIVLNTTALDFKVISPALQPSQIIPIPENRVVTNSTRVTQTTLEGASFFIHSPILVSKITARATAVGGGANIMLAIYQGPNGSSGTMSNRILTFPNTDPIANNTTFTSATATEGTQLLHQGVVYILFGRSTGGNCTLRTYSNSLMDVLTVAGTIAAGQYPTLFSTAFAAGSPPATFDPLTQATVSANDVNVVCRLTR